MLPFALALFVFSENYLYCVQSGNIHPFTPYPLINIILFCFLFRKFSLFLLQFLYRWKFSVTTN